MTTKILLALALALPVVACDLESTLDRDRAGDLQVDEGRPHHRLEPPPLLLLRLAVQQGALDEEPAMQAALERLHERHDASMARRHELRGALATAVEAGRVDASTFTASLDAIEAAARGEAGALTDALAVAHGLLDETERDAVVDSLPPPPARTDGPPPRGDEQGPPPREGGAGERPPGPGGDLLASLQLDDAQRQALREALGEPPRREPPPPVDLTTFAEADFDASTLGLAELHARHQREEAAHVIALVGALVPLLDDDQRRALIERLREAVPRGPARQRSTAG